MRHKRAFFIVVFLFLSLACNAVSTAVPTPAVEPVSQVVEPSPTPAPISLSGLVYGVDDSNGKAVWQIGQDGDPHILIPDRSSAIFSPDGKQAIYSDNFFETFSGCIWLADSVSKEVRALDCSDGPNALGEPSIPATILGWVPNDPDLVYAIVDQSGGGMGGYSGYLGTISLADGSKTILDREHSIHSYDVEISPNGKQIAYGSGIYSSGAGYKEFNPAEYGVKDPYDAFRPNWSPDGKKMAWGIIKNDENSLRSASLGIFDLTNKTAQIVIDPYSPKELTDTDMAPVPYAFWSPDSQWLAVDISASTESGEYDAEKNGWWIISVDGSKQYKVDATEFDSWSPDSQWIAYISRADADLNVLELRVSHPDGSSATKLGELEDFYGTKLWSRDGRSLVFVDANNKVRLANANGWDVSDITTELGISDASAKINLITWIDPLPISFEGLTSLPTPSPEPVFSCPDAPRTRLHVGDTARITFTDGSTTRLRSAPESGDNGIDRLPEGTEFEIVGGPICYPRPGRSDAYVYWQVTISSRDKTGWLAEGDFNGYYLEPWP